MTGPSSYGFDAARFPSFREGQHEVARQIADSDKRVTILNMPTGSGKSLAYMTAAKMIGVRTLVLTQTRGLQDQLVADFGGIGAVDVRGMGNYTCLGFDEGGPFDGWMPAGSKCDDGPCRTGEPCAVKDIGECYYYRAIQRASCAPIVPTNYAMWMAQRRSDALGDFGLIVCDEAHGAGDWVTREATVTLRDQTVRALINYPLLPLGASLDAHQRWARQALHEVAAYQPRIAATNLQMRLDMGKLKRSLHALLSAPRGTGKVVIDEGERGGQRVVKFIPLWPKKYAESYLFRGIPRVVLASATVTPRTAARLGIHRSDVEFIEAGRGFPPQRRPTIFINTKPKVRLNAKTAPGLIDTLIDRMDAIIEARPDTKGVVHTRSYRRAEYVCQRSRVWPRLWRLDRENLAQTMEKFYETDQPVVLVGPGLEEGIDLADDRARFQIIFKIPFLPPNDPLVAARKRSDPSWYNEQTATAITQIAGGRVCRSVTDWGETLVLDAGWEWVSERYWFPEWFKRSWRSGTGEHALRFDR